MGVLTCGAMQLEEAASKCGCPKVTLLIFYDSPRSILDWTVVTVRTEREMGKGLGRGVKTVQTPALRAQPQIALSVHQ